MQYLSESVHGGRFGNISAGFVRAVSGREFVASYNVCSQAKWAQRFIFSFLGIIGGQMQNVHFVEQMQNV